MTSRTQATRSQLIRDPQRHAHDLPKGIELLHDPMFNKGTAFTEAERDAFGLRGLLPPRIFAEYEQEARVMENIRRKPNNLEKYIYLIGLQDRNETLFYRVLIDNLAELMPIVYTPTVGQACIEYGSIFRRARGLFISMRDRGHIKDVLRNWPYEDVRVIVVTDGERILGLGDLGANGMGIPVGKLSLYTGCAGIHPATCLPITIDVGTNNESLRTHPMYIGLSEPRMRGEIFDDIIDEFLAAAHEVFPNAIIQLEDFGNADAFRLLSEYRHKYCLFDDDIQGTAGVVLAGMYSSLRITGGKLSDHRFLFVGAGQAGIGTGDLLVAAMIAEGMDAKEARERCWFMDSKGLVVASRQHLTEQKDRYAHEGTFVETPLEAVEMLKPTVLIGASGKPHTFSTDILKLMAKNTERPVIFALSNPTANSECTAEEAYTHTDGRAIFATGSPFPPFSYGGKTFVPGQANNSYIFPGVGLGVMASRARHVPDEMFFAAAQTLAHEVSTDDLDVGRIYPPLSRIRDVSAKIATAVAKVAIERGLSDLTLTESLEDDIRRHMYEPEYRPYV